MDKLKGYLEQYKKAKILDVGTGRGDFISLIDYLYKDYSEICGTDLTEKLLENNKIVFKDNKRITFIKDDILNTNLPKKSYDIVCLSNTLHHLADINITIDSMKNLLKDDGIIIINEMFSDNLNKSQVSHRLLHHFAAKVDREIGRYHDETFTKNEIINRVKNFPGLIVEDFWEMDYPEKEVIHEVKNFIGLIDALLKLVNDSSSYEEFVKEGQKIKDYLGENGFQSATQLLCILKKKEFS